MDPNAGYPTGFPQNQQMPFYPNSIPQYQPNTPQQQPHSFGAMPMQPSPGGVMMPSGFQQSPAPLENFSAPFSQPPVAANMNQFPQPQGTMANTPSTVAQTFSQNMASLSANNMLPNQQKPQPQTSSPQTAPQPMSPAQAQAQAREKARVTTLLDINSTLLQEVVNLQAAGKAGAASNNPNQDTSEQLADAPKAAAQKPSQEYIECMRRLQANLAYLATIADRAKKSGGVAPQAPAIMTPPPNLPVVHELYGKLNELFPRGGKVSEGTPQAKLTPPGMQGNGGPSPSLMSESVV
ncbi:uncharacterized protein PFLUO_LOCUS8576 [Penicillium psychrofluorescens]|uniref:uncharacterized protein n=1 Tax=Penicillium psychrofluorescens TaxID=3158075 RepID=UPI003CCC98D2